MLKVEKLSLNRGAKTITEQLTFHLKKGELLKLSGPNGSGKSSLAMAIAGDIPKTSGEIKCDGKIGYLMQSLEIDFPITVTEFIQLARPKADIRNLLEKLNLTEITNKKITQISMGQLQRAEIAQILLQDPDLIILDEPFSAQDAENTLSLVRLIENLKSEGKSFILINHIDMDISDLVDQEISLG